MAYIKSLDALAPKREGVKARFEIKHRSKHDMECIYIIDHAEYFQCMSVTNDAEAVVKYLWDYSSLGEFKHLYYKDTDGRIDELMFKNDEFMGFKRGWNTEKELYCSK